MNGLAVLSVVVDEGRARRVRTMPSTGRTAVARTRYHDTHARRPQGTVSARQRIADQRAGTSGVPATQAIIAPGNSAGKSRKPEPARPARVLP
jgi:hypothetical protein